ncbi:MAG: hypothetical protein WCA44_18005 [Acidobacteriaceae bacterium]
MRIFGCPHRRITWPMKLDGRKLITVSCHDCCRRLPYDWDRMRVVSPLEARRAARAAEAAA